MAILKPSWMDEPSLPLYREPESPSLLNTLGAAFRQENSIVSAANNGFRGLGRIFRFNPDFNPYDDKSISEHYQSYYDRFLFAEDQEDVEFIKLSIDQELRDRDTLARAGKWGFATSMLAGTIDPVNLIPIGGSLKGLSEVGGMSARIIAGAGRVAVGGALGAAAQEIPLYFTQYTRTPEEGIVSVGAGAILGSILGGFAGMLPVGERVKFQENIQKDMVPVQPTGKVFYGGFGGDETAVQALDRAFDEGTIDQGAYRLMKQKVIEDSGFDAQSSIELIDAVRYAQDEDLRSYGWTQKQIDEVNANPEIRPRIFGETHTRQTGDILHTAIRLYHGHDADTVVEEWFHRSYDRLPKQDRLLFEEYHGKSGDKRPVNEHFAQEGRDYFFSTGGHKEIGGIKSIFQRAKDILRALIDRIRLIRGANLPDKIKELYRKAGEPAKELQPLKNKNIIPSKKGLSGIIQGKEELQLGLAEHLVGLEQKFSRYSKSEIVRIAKERRISVGSSGRKQLIPLILEDEKNKFEKGLIPKSQWELPDEFVEKAIQDERENVSFQIREVYKTLANLPDFPEGVDPNKVRRPNIIPERLWKVLANVHPGLKVHTMKYLKKPAEIFNNLLEGSERTWKNLFGIRNEEAAETQINRSKNKYNVRHDSIFWDNYWNLQKRLTGEAQKLQGTQRGKIQQRLFFYRKLDQYKREVYEALQELHGGKSVTKVELSKKFDPEVIKAAREIGEIYNELGKRLEAVGLLPSHLKELLQTGYVHIPRIWLPGYVRKYRAALIDILKSEERSDDLPFLTSPEETEKIVNSNKAEKVIDSILDSPSGYLGIQINSVDPTDIGTARFLEERMIDIDSRKLWAEVDGKKIDFVETDPEIIFKNYVDSIMPDIILAERFGKKGVSGEVAITLKPAFDAILEEANEKIKALGDKHGKAYNEILAERDTAIKTFKAMRDVIRGDYRPNGRRDLSTFAARAPGILLTLNAMQGLGGIVVSSLGDIVTSIAHVGLEPYAKGISHFLKMQGTELFSKWRKEVTHVWGVAGEMSNSARYGAVTDIYDVGSGVSAPERLVNFWGRQMGLVTGIDWWNSKMKLMTTFVIQHALLEQAEKLAKAIDSGKIETLNIKTAEKIVSKDDLVDFASMGIGIDDLVAIWREVKANGEIHDGLTLPRTTQWADRELASRFESAMAKKVDAIIVTPSAGDKPLWTRYGIGKMVSQFKSYPMAAMRKILFRGLQNPDQKLAVGTLASTMMGGLIYTLKTLERGETPQWDNPAQFLYESIDRTGLFGYLTDANNYIEKLTYNRVGIAPLLQPLVGLESASRGRWQESLIDLAFGPTGDTIEGYHRFLTSTIPHAVFSPFGTELTSGDINQAFKLVWYSRLAGVRSAMEWLRNQAVDHLAVNPPKGRNENRLSIGD